MLYISNNINIFLLVYPEFYLILTLGKCLLQLPKGGIYLLLSHLGCEFLLNNNRNASIIGVCIF